MIRDLTDAEARAALLKWSAVPEGTIPAWVAEMDYAPAPAVTAAVAAALRTGRTGYPHLSLDGAEDDGSDTAALAGAFRGFAARHWGWDVPAGSLTLTPDVVTGLRVAVETLVPPGPVVLPTPCYPPFRELLALAAREVVALPVDPDAPTATLDLDRLEAAFAAGARGLLLCSPHNPLGRRWTRAELEAVRDLAERHGARVVADEVHAPLVLPEPDGAAAPDGSGGAGFTPYLAVDPRGITVTSASKAFNVPGLACAHLVTPDPADAAALRGVVHSANHGVSRLGVAAGVAAWSDADDWLAALVERLAAQRALLADLLAAHLPQARTRPLEATYLAWLDLRAYGVPDPAAAARAHGAWPAPGQDYEPGLEGHVRLNLATTPERLEALVERIARALT
ncbi:aminotransferase class I/II-fold pyridoxal phosphate-dependent enzyme [Nocardioides sp. ChNu-153]|uniref:MalY/PatB family protein n=1 Tax=unclassified Nocardioides TaxID=2615069 RepID=UPI0024074E5D|nr:MULTISPECIES: aminotransferase class I/II-fold pyridoxal phosphate-dependent enzyme [unclassified Nocardioides]MDF9716174.1 aminotransferase class I/II-fold pyridoxal phosphate-dependent enzyme [Nocardioides sp. ChNu-99]MDN7121564.1 aminotransferase class I/II-fold pyridoxal phosphate-dependent enzyme [Nocardioides sp. ChNu-153]